MAGDGLVDKWILEYVCYKAWKEFETNKNVSNRTVDHISAVIAQDSAPSPTDAEKIYFLVVLCRLNDGEKIFVEYTSSQETTVLEDLIPMFEKLARCQTEELMQEGIENVDQLIKSEAVLVCCRQGDYTRASEVFQRQWSKVNSKSKKDLVRLKTLLKDFVDQKSGSEDQLKTFTYTNFLDSIMKYLRKTQHKFDVPLLVKAAETKINRTIEEETILKERSYNSKKFKKDDMNSATEIENKNKNGQSKAKLRQLWNNNLKEMFGSQNPEKQKTADHSQESMGDGDQADTQEDISAVTRKPSSSNHSPSPNLSPFKRPSGSPAPQSTKSSSKYFAVPSPIKQSQKKPVGSSPKTPLSRSTYRKNEGRPNRHEPTAADQGDNDTNSFDSDSDDNMSIVSVSSRRKWTDEEAEDLYDAVKMYGVGQWCKIRDHLGTIRTNVMIKDKWRTMVKRGDVEQIKANRSKKRKKTEDE